MKFAFVAAEKASFPVAFMCRHLEVSRSGFYAWYRRNYGSPRLHEDLKAEGEKVSRKRVVRLWWPTISTTSTPRPEGIRRWAISAQSTTKRQSGWAGLHEQGVYRIGAGSPASPNRIWKLVRDARV